MADRPDEFVLFSCWADFDLVVAELDTRRGKLRGALTMAEAEAWRDKLDAAIQEAKEAGDGD